MFHKCSCRKVLVSWIKTTFDRDSKDSVYLSSFNIGSCNCLKGKTGWCQGGYMTGLMEKMVPQCRQESSVPLNCQHFSRSLQAWPFLFQEASRAEFVFMWRNRCSWLRCWDRARVALCGLCSWWQEKCVLITAFPSFPAMDKTTRQTFVFYFTSWNKTKFYQIIGKKHENSKGQENRMPSSTGTNMARV